MKLSSVVVALVAVTYASAAAAEDTTAIPFAPPVPSVFTIDEVRTMTVPQVDGTAVSTSRMRYRLEFRALGESYDAIWTLLSVQNSGDPEASNMLQLGPLAERFVGFPVELTLDRFGDITGLVNLDEVNRLLLADLAPDQRPLWTNDARRVAAIIAAPLTFVAPCHDTDWQAGRLDRREREDASSDGAYVSTVATTLELRSLSHQSESARIAFTRTEGTREKSSAADAPVLFGLNIRSDCTVDLRTGLTLGATSETRGLGEGVETFVMHSEMTWTRQ